MEEQPLLAECITEAMSETVLRHLAMRYSFLIPDKRPQCLIHFAHLSRNA